MPWGIAASVAGSLLTSSSKNKANKNANNATQAGIAGAQEAIQDAGVKAAGYLKPTVTQGVTSNARLNSAVPGLYNEGKAGVKALHGEQGKLNIAEYLDPSMKYSMKNAQDAIQASAAARGGLLSGATLKALNESASQIATQNYNNAAQLALSDRGQQVGIGNSLVGVGNQAIGIDQTLTGYGANAATNQAQAASSVGENMAILSQSSGNSNAAAAANNESGAGMLGGIIGGLGELFSDKTLKENVRTVTDAEIDEFLSQLEPSQYDYIEDAVEKGAPMGKQVGVMAQDVEKSKIGKRLVEEDEDGDKMLDVAKSVGAMMASVSSLNKRLKKVEGK